MRYAYALAALATFTLSGAILAAPGPAPSLAEQARARSATLDREARAATLRGEQALRSAAALAARVQNAEAGLADTSTRLAALRAERARIASDLAARRLPTARLAAGLAAEARQPALLGLLRPGSLQDTVHLRAMMAALVPQIEARTAGIRRTLARAKVVERQTARLLAQQAAMRRDLMLRQRELAALAEAERLKARRASSAADREAERALLGAAGTRPPDRFAGGLDAKRASTPAPVAGAPRPYRLPVRGGWRFEDNGGLGVVLAPAPGALVVAPAAGRVSFAGPYEGYGAIVIVEHPGGWSSLVTGMATAGVATGQGVIAGSPIGRAPAADPQIGLELRRGAERVPVLQLLPPTRTPR